jgi:iron-sulfur cluster repair protein YtfE (RIC family)
MRRHDSLIPLTHDHHHALVQAKKLRTAAEGQDEGRLAASKEFLEFFHRDTIQHFREEEEVVFPMVVDEQDLRGTLERVMMDHLHIHALVRRLAAECEGGIPRTETLLELASTLEGHVRLEEKVLFPQIEERAGDLESISLAQRRRAGP